MRRGEGIGVMDPVEVVESPGELGVRMGASSVESLALVLPQLGVSRTPLPLDEVEAVSLAPA